MKKNFTIVELLVVIAVIGILAGLLLPALAGVKENGKLTQARTDCASIRTAILSFYSEYSYLPIAAATTGNDTMINTVGTAVATATTAVNVPAEKYSMTGNDYYILFDRLCMPSTLLATDADSTKFNKKKISFLSPSAKYNSSNAGEKGFRDPWLRPYFIMLDTNYNGKIENVPSSFGVDGNTLIDRVGVVSFGRNADGAFKADLAAFSWK